MMQIDIDFDTEEHRSDKSMFAFEQRIAALSPDKRRLLELRLQAQRGTHALGSTIARRDSGKPAPLAYAQQRIWFLDQLQPELTAYNGVSAYSLRGVLNLSALQQSLNEIVRRHESLRTTFAINDGQPVQVIHPEAEFPLLVEDLSQLPADCWDTQIEERVMTEGNRPFDLTQHLPRRARLLRFGEQQHALILTNHHIASDGWSDGVFWRELAILYSAFAQGNPSPLPELPIQYVDYAIRQRESLHGDIWWVNVRTGVRNWQT